MKCRSHFQVVFLAFSREAPWKGVIRVSKGGGSGASVPSLNNLELEVGIGWDRLSSGLLSTP